MTTKSYLLKRITQSLLTLWTVITLSFALIHALPGGPKAFIQSQALAGGSSGEAAATARLEQFNFDAPLFVQYKQYVISVFHGDFGTSYHYREPVADVIISAAPWTIFLMGSALILTYIVGIALGATFAYKQNSRFDRIGSAAATFLNSIPYYLLGVVLVYVLGYQLNVFPSKGMYGDNVSVGANVRFIASVLYHGFIPMVSVIVTAFGFRALAMRGNSIQTLGKPFVRVAELRGLSDNRITIQYVGRNAILPMYTSFMITIGFMFSAAVILEEIFQWRGVGWYLLKAIGARDYPLMMGAFILITVFVVVSLLIADLTYSLIDPTAGSVNQSSYTLGIKELVYRFERLLRSSDYRPNLGPDTPSDRSRTQSSSKAQAPNGGSPPGGVGTSESIFTPVSDAPSGTGVGVDVSELVLDNLRIIWNDTRVLIGGGIIVLYLVVAFSVLVLPSPSTYRGEALLQIGETLRHPLGTDGLGRDLLLLSVYATGPVFKMVFSGALFATTVATVIGLVSGYVRGIVDRILMTMTDIVLSIPSLPLLVVLAAIFQPENPFVIGVLLTINAWGGVARQIRSQVLTLRNEMYVEASQVMALSTHTVLLKDVLPNIMPFVSIKFVQLGRRVIFAAVGLYFLGVLSTGGYNWGITIYTAYKSGALYSWSTAHWIIVPTASVVLLTYGLVMLSQGMDKIFNPRIRADDENEL